MKMCFVGLENLPVVSSAHRHLGVGGEQVQQTLLARALVRRGFDVSMVVADYGQEDGMQIDGIRLHKAHGLHEGIPVLRFVHPRLTRLWSALSRADADVYYVSCAGPQLGFVTAFARQWGRRVIFRIAHDRDCDPHQLLVRYARDRLIYAWGLRRADVVLAQTEQQQRALRLHYGVDSQVAAMLVDPPQPPRSFAERDVDVLWVNNLRPFKRPEWVPELARRLPGMAVHMIGGPQPGYGDLYEQVAAAAQAEPNLHFHGPVPYASVNAWFERARVFVNTSESEGFPNAYLQAWRRGVPTVTFFDPDRLIDRHGLGWAVQSLDEMARVVQRLAGDGPAWSQVSRRCRQYMDAHHGEDVVLAPYLQALEGAAASTVPSTAWRRAA